MEEGAQRKQGFGFRDQAFSVLAGIPFFTIPSKFFRSIEASVMLILSQWGNFHTCHQCLNERNGFRPQLQ
jgi:hypothetical protein